MVRWGCFDVGKVFLDEDPLTYQNFRHRVEAIRGVRPGRNCNDLLAERAARAAAGDPNRWPDYRSND